MNVVFRAIWHMMLWGIPCGGALGALYGSLLSFGFGTIVGLFYGELAGLATGFVSGLVVGLVTRGFFYPLADRFRYRWAVGIVCAAVSFGGALICFPFWLSNEWFQFAIAPALIASAAATFAAQRFATKYVREQQLSDEESKQMA